MTFVRELMLGKPAEIWSIGPRDTVYKALQLMAEKNVGALPVIDPVSGNLIGMFSERDYAAQADPEGEILPGDGRGRADELARVLRASR